MDKAFLSYSEVVDCQQAYYDSCVPMFMDCEKDCDKVSLYEADLFSKLLPGGSVCDNDIHGSANYISRSEEVFSNSTNVSLANMSQVFSYSSRWYVLACPDQDGFMWQDVDCKVNGNDSSLISMLVSQSGFLSVTSVLEDVQQVNFSGQVDMLSSVVTQTTVFNSESGSKLSMNCGKFWGIAFDQGLDARAPSAILSSAPPY